MSSWNPMDELGDSLASIDAKKDRTISVPPPPTDDFTAEVERPDAPVETSEEAGSEPAASSSEPEPVIALPARSRGRGKSRGLAIRRPIGPMKAISADLPAHLVETVTELRLDADVEGRPFKLTELMSASLLELPSRASQVAALCDRYAAQFNYGRMSRDDDFLEETRFSTQITPDADKHVSKIVRAVYKEYGAKMSRKDLYAVALLSALAGCSQ